MVIVELVQKTTEIVFLVADIFAYRAPPIRALAYAKANMPEIYEEYSGYVKEFFSPDPPGKGYNPTVAVNDPNSPIIEDRRRIARVISRSLTYAVIQHLRERPKKASEICEKSALPEKVVNQSLWELENERVAARLEDGSWALITDPIVETFVPEFVLPVIAKRVAEKEIGVELGRRHLQLLLEKWSERR